MKVELESKIKALRLSIYLLDVAEHLHMRNNIMGRLLKSRL
jgi:hypothetical protein